MANTDAPFGLRPVRHKSGAPYNGSFTPYAVPAGYATALFIGDAVTKTSTANAAAITVPGGGHFPIGTLSEVNKTAAGTGNPITGVIVGFAANPDALGTKHSPASTGGVAYVADDPDLVFEIQADGAVPVANVGLNAVLVYTNAGSAITGLSGAELNSANPATTAAFQLNIKQVVNRVDNEGNAAGNKVLVSINNHTEVAGAAGI